MLIHEIYILIFCNWNYLLVRYFSNPKLVFRNKYVTSLPSFNISFERCQSRKYFFTRDCRSDWSNLLLFKCIVSWILKILSNFVTKEYHDVLFIECSFLLHKKIYANAIYCARIKTSKCNSFFNMVRSK